MFPKKESYIFLFFILFSITLRFYSFFPAVMDHDESTYLIIGRDIMQGQKLYEDVTDTKPVGVFVIYGLFYLLFGNSIFLSRVVVAVIVGTTAYVLYKSSFKIFNQRNSALAAGIIYLFYTSTWTKFGVAPNTELFFNLTTIFGFFLLLDRKRSKYAFAGLLFGIGFMIKYMVLFDFVFLSAFFLFSELVANHWSLRKIGMVKFVLAGLGFSLPFVATNLWFYFSGHYEAFKYITYELPSHYGQTRNLVKYLIIFIDFIARFLPISFFIFYVLLSKGEVFKKWQVQMFLIWIAGIMLAIYLPGKNYGHYTIQLMLPLSLVAGTFFHPNIQKGRFLNSVTGKKYGIYFFAGAFILVEILGIQGKIADEDHSREVAAYLNKNMDKNETLYLSNYKHIVYYLLERKSPTKYVHPSLLTNPNHSRAFGINGQKEIDAVMETHPDVVVSYRENPFIAKEIEQRYKVDTTFAEGNVIVYRLR